MAGYRGHIYAAVAVGVVLVGGLAISPLGATLSASEKIVKATGVLGIAIVFGLFPDVDIKSRGQLLFFRLVFALDVLLVATGRFREAAILGLIALVSILSRHRGWTHTVWAALLVPLPILVGAFYLARESVGNPYVDGLPYYLGAVAGYMSHLLLDGTLVRPRRRKH